MWVCLPEYCSLLKMSRVVRFQEQRGLSFIINVRRGTVLSFTKSIKDIVVPCHSVISFGSWNKNSYMKNELTLRFRLRRNAKQANSAHCP
jgi:hypothetical protein